MNHSVARAVVEAAGPLRVDRDMWRAGRSSKWSKARTRSTIRGMHNALGPMQR